MPEYRDIYDALRRKVRVLPRGAARGPEEYTLGVCVWLRRADGRFLISRRAAAKADYPLLWEPTGGGVLAGETSLEAAHREVKEELGLALNDARGALFATVQRQAPLFSAASFEDIYVFQGDWPLSDIVFQKEETCDARWASQEEILALMARGAFVPARYYPYLEALFARFLP